MEGFFGATPAAIAALICNKYMRDFKVDKESLSMMSVNDHLNGSKNPDAHYRNLLTLEAAMNSTAVSEPLNLMDCCPLSDGAAALVLVSESYMKKNNREGVRILSSSVSQDYLAFHSRKSLYTFDSTKIAARKAFGRSKLKPSDISFAEIHDSYSIYGLFELEDLGFAEKGKAKDLVYEDIKLNGSIPVNPSGGLKAKGNPFGATGIGQFVDADQQLKGKGKDRQVKSPSNALLHSMSISGSTSVVHILGGDYDGRAFKILERVKS